MAMSLTPAVTNLNSKEALHYPFWTMLARGATQLNAANDIRTKTKALLIQLLAVHGRDNINVFAETRRRLEIENFPKAQKRQKIFLLMKPQTGDTRTC
eukprot:13902942-Ditylum_brightwellii.AAC.1